MARRKQRRPQHFENERELAQSLQNGIGSGSDTEEDEHVCGKCRAEFPSLSDFLEHKKLCVSKRPVLVHPPHDSSVDTEDEEEGDEQCERMAMQVLEKNYIHLRQHPLENANSIFWNSMNPLLLLAQHQRTDSNVILEELKNTRVAVAQHGNPVESTFQELLSKFRQSQVENLHMIKSLESIVMQNILATTAGSSALNGAAAPLTPLKAMEGPSVASSAPSSNLEAYPQGSRTEEEDPQVPLPENSLALLEKQTERYLQDSMSRKSFTFNGIEDDKSKRSKTDDPSSRHRCAYCGKLLGSDSALQIHIRSHTGEKPFSCDVCKSSFSTRGNLKVHFQRHRENPEELLAVSSVVASGVPAIDGQRKQLDNRNGESSKGDQALDFSTSMNGRKSPNDDNSRSVSPNDMSNFSDNSDGSSDENMTAENFSELKIDVERFDEDDRDNSNMDDDGSEVASSQAGFGTSPNFSSYFLPSNYDNFAASHPGPSSNNNNVSNGGAPNNDGSDSILQDPTYYQDLLPRIGSNDNSWESLIEVTKTSETSKLQQLVDNIEHKLIEPNQCIICHRVLSCKSALQMHYRTHTGERPFKCKLCSRAFTTKGNLKTHMGVHRTKPTSRLLHQCPVCHKPFPNTVLLQQHIRSHTENHALQLAPLYASCDDRPPTLLPPSYPRQFLMPPQLMNSEPLALTSSKPQESKGTSANESVIKTTNSEPSMSLNQCTSPALSSADSCSPPCNTDEIVAKELQPPVLDLAQPEQHVTEEKINDSPSDIPRITDINNSSPDRGTLPDRSSPEDRANFDTNVKEEPPNLVQSPKNFTGCQNLNASPPNMSAKSPPKFSPMENSFITLASDRPLPMTLPSDCPLPFSVHNSDRPYPPMSVPDFTTASLTALENHVKGIASNVSHPLPFPPHFGLGLNVPSFYRDFSYPHKSSTSSPSASKNGSDGSADERSTPGTGVTSSKGESPRTSVMITHSTPKSENSNGIGALDLTPRNSPGFQRPSGSDMKIFAPLAGLPFVAPQHRLGTTCRICYKTFACQSALEIHYRSHTKERPYRCEVCDRGFSTKGNMRQHMLTHKIRDLPAQVFSSSSNAPTVASTPSRTEVTEEKSPPKKAPEEAAKRAPTDVSLPQPKRPPGQPKHLCQVCNKPFSSGSALQIHMRTHTGDKPFQCNICHRAFTTKGNLKVHMGTHMWNNSTSRRGRRMSLDITPLQLPGAPGAKPGEFPQPSYFPYLPPFINGLPPPPQAPPKMNEISVIQTAGVSNGAIITAPPATTSSSAPSTPQQPLPLLSTSKREEQIPSQNQNYMPGHC